jgi:hypothetical protein
MQTSPSGTTTNGVVRGTPPARALAPEGFYAGRGPRGDVTYRLAMSQEMPPAAGT